MVVLSRKLDYALICLAHLAERQGVVTSAREIAEGNSLPGAVTGQILKRLHRHGVIESVRGSTGGYRVSPNTRDLNLQELVAIVQDAAPDRTGASERVTHGPVRALHYKLVRFLKDVKLSDLVLPGRRIDVPLEMLGVSERTQTTVS